MNKSKNIHLNKANKMLEAMDGKVVCAIILSKEWPKRVRWQEAEDRRPSEGYEQKSLEWHRSDTLTSESGHRGRNVEALPSK